jgi:RNA polymerase sigma factor for flagellar operon FliA
VKLEPDDLIDVWVDFKRTGDQELRNRLVLHYASLVRYVAAKVGGRLPPSVDRDDLISYGMFGLLDAIEKFRLDAGVKFETYSIPRIKGAIFDEMRKLDWVPRSVRSRVKDLEEVRAEVEAVNDGRATNELMASAMGLSEHDFLTTQSQASVTHVESLAGFYEVMEVSDFSMSPESLAQTGEIADLLGEAVNGMDERSKTILVLYYLHEMTLAEIGKILGVTESRVCQLQSKVLMTLRETLGQGGLSVA